MKTKEPKEKPVKVKKIKKSRSISKSVVGTLIAFVLASLVMVGFLYIQAYYGNDIIYTEVIIAKTDIPVNTTVTKENASNYFIKQNVDSKVVPDTALTNLDDVQNLKTNAVINKNEVITKNNFSNITEAAKEFTDPVETSISIASLADIVAGKVRGGDVINITISYALVNDVDVVSGSLSDSAEKEAIKTPKKSLVVLENVYVTGVYDANGTAINTNDTTSNASVIKFTLEREDEAKLNLALANGSYMRISKTLNH